MPDNDVAASGSAPPGMAAYQPVRNPQRGDRDVLDEGLRHELRVGQDIEALRSLPTGECVTTLVGNYAMNAETIRGEGRWHWLELNGRRVSGTPDSGRPDAVRRFAARHYRDLIERERLYGPARGV